MSKQCPKAAEAAESKQCETVLDSENWIVRTNQSTRLKQADSKTKVCAFRLRKERKVAREKMYERLQERE